MTEITVAFPVTVGAAEVSRPTLVLQAKEAVRSALDGTTAGAACDGCTVQPDRLAWYEKAGGRFMVCPVCFHARKLAQGDLLPTVELGAVQRWAWIGDDGATTLGYRRMNNWRKK
jgi:hypothetical protein